MSWTESREEKLVYEWICQNQNFFSFQENTFPMETYYCPFDNTSNVCSYGFASIPELEEQLDKFWRDDPVFCNIRRVCAVAAFKRQPTPLQAKGKEEGREDSLKIPDFVYVF